MADSNPAPLQHIPRSKHTVEVSIIDTTSKLTFPASAFMASLVSGFTTVSEGPCTSFLVRHRNLEKGSKYDTLLFDLATRKDVENGPPAVLKAFSELGVIFDVKRNVCDILQDHGDDPAEVGAIIWSHWHLDHIGDPSTFPKSTDLVIGPGFKNAFVPAWPTKDDGVLDEKAWEGREFVEMDFDAHENRLTLCGYKAIDLYGDGSFYLLHTPRHAIGHVSALARTSAEPAEFILMGGDSAHQCGEFRPTVYKPLPDIIQPDPLAKPYKQSNSVCLGSLYEAIHPRNSTTEPFMEANGMMHHDSAEAQQSIQKLLPLDGQDNIFTVLAHDRSMMDVVEFYPKPANEWTVKGWKEQAFWRFLNDYDTNSGEVEKK